MAGPTAGIVLPRVLTDVETTEVWNSVVALGQERDRPYFWVETTYPIGGSYAGEGRPFALQFQSADRENDPEDIDEMERLIGYRPCQEIGIAAMCGGDQDHRILGELCAWLAERFNGMIDFGGNLPVPLPPEVRERLNKLWWGHPGRTYTWADLQPSFQQMIRGMPGRLLQSNDSRYSSPQHFADAAFMRAWLQHPNFRMVK